MKTLCQLLWHAVWPRGSGVASSIELTRLFMTIYITCTGIHCAVGMSCRADQVMVLIWLAGGRHDSSRLYSQVLRWWDCLVSIKSHRFCSGFIGTIKLMYILPFLKLPPILLTTFYWSWAHLKFLLLILLAVSWNVVAGFHSPWDFD